MLLIGIFNQRYITRLNYVLLQEAIEKLKIQLEHFQEYQKSILNDIDAWKYQQKLAHCGYPEPGPLDEVKK